MNQYIPHLILKDWNLVVDIDVTQQRKNNTDIYLHNKNLVHWSLVGLMM